MRRLDALVHRRRRMVLAAWAVVRLAALPLAAHQSDRLTGGGFGVQGSRSDRVEKAVPSDFDRTKAATLGAVLVPARGALAGEMRRLGGGTAWVPPRCGGCCRRAGSRRRSPDAGGRAGGRSSPQLICTFARRQDAGPGRGGGETHMATSERAVGSFPSPFEIETPPGCEGWEEMYPHYALFAEERREPDEARLWFWNSMHFPVPMPAFDVTSIDGPYYALGAWQNRAFAVPPAMGIDYRVVNSYIYISVNPVTDPAKIAERAEFFRSAPATTSRTGTSCTGSGAARWTRCSRSSWRSRCRTCPTTSPTRSSSATRTRASTRSSTPTRGACGCPSSCGSTTSSSCCSGTART